MFFRIAKIKLGGVGVILFCWLCFLFLKVVLLIVVLMRSVFFTLQKRETWTYDCGKLINQSLKIELGQMLQESKGKNLMNMCILLRPHSLIGNNQTWHFQL